MGGFSFDERYFPLVLVTAPSLVEAPALTALFASFERTFQRRSRYALLLDLSPVSTIPGAGLRKMIAEWEAAHVEETRTWNVGAALVVHSMMVRGALTALSWLVSEESPRIHVATLGEGVEWCCKKLESEGIEFSPSLTEARTRGVASTLAV